MKFQAPHEVRDETKLAALIAVLESGGELPPVVVEPNGIQAITGSHRIAAYDAVGQDVPALVLSESDYLAACEYLGVEYLDDERDKSEVARAIYETTDDEDIKGALRDQLQ